MAIYHCSIKIISRSDGKSAVASSAYRSGEKLMDGRTGLVHDFTKKRGVVFTEVVLPAHAPPEYADRNVLWTAVEKAEKKSNAQLAREIEVALPKELSRECQIEIVRRYVQDNSKYLKGEYEYPPHHHYGYYGLETGACYESQEGAECSFQRIPGSFLAPIKF